jgi:hypothetical protein
LADAAAQTSEELPDLRFTEKRLDFGCVGVDFKVRHHFKLVNYGSDTIYVDTVSNVCDCTEVRFRDSTVAPGDTASILMIFNTANMYGPMEKDLRVHCSDSKEPKKNMFYAANIGQWLFKVEPKPVNVFFLPGQNSRASTFLNHALDKISLQDIYLDENIVEIRTVKAVASKGESLELEITAKPDLPAGTHLTNYTVTIDLHQDLPPLRITIPVKVVKY